MEHRLILFGIVLAFLSSSCRTPAYLPEAEEIGSNQFGSYIEVHMTKGAAIEGELIAIETEALRVLTEGKENTHLRTIPVADIEGFKLRYAQPENHGWTIPVFGLISLFHGYFALVTIPSNIIATSIITTRGTRAFTYNEKDMTWEKLKMFARFPQGLPAHIDLANLQ